MYSSSSQIRKLINKNKKKCLKGGTAAEPFKSPLLMNDNKVLGTASHSGLAPNQVKSQKPWIFTLEAAHKRLSRKL
jgi:hypothetical protein